MPVTRPRPRYETRVGFLAEGIPDPLRRKEDDEAKVRSQAPGRLDSRDWIAIAAYDHRRVEIVPRCTLDQRHCEAHVSLRSCGIGPFFAKTCRGSLLRWGKPSPAQASRCPGATRRRGRPVKPSARGAGPRGWPVTEQVRPGDGLVRAVLCCPSEPPSVMPAGTGYLSSDRTPEQGRKRHR